MINYKCIKCGHRWIPRTPNKPRECPNCKNRAWNNKNEKK